MAGSRGSHGSLAGAKKIDVTLVAHSMVCARKILGCRAQRRSDGDFDVGFSVLWWQGAAAALIYLVNKHRANAPHRLSRVVLMSPAGSGPSPILYPHRLPVFYDEHVRRRHYLSRADSRTPSPSHIVPVPSALPLRLGSRTRALCSDSRAEKALDHHIYLIVGGTARLGSEAQMHADSTHDGDDGVDDFALSSLVLAW